MINTDTYLKIGDQHKICEDYVISGVTRQGNPPLEYIILSDGCSSSDKTEMGARILCYIAQQYIRFNFREHPFFPDYKRMGLWIIHNSEMVARNMGLNRDSLDATLLISWIDWSNLPCPFSNIYMYGDGFVISKANNGLDVTEVDFRPDNAPYYLSYELDPARKAAYHDLRVSKMLTVTHGNGSKTEEQFAYDAPAQFSFNMDYDHTILLASDGMGSFYRDDGSGHPPTLITADTMAPGFIDFKGKKGSYLQRRASKEIKRLAKDDTFHFDDLSIGAYINEDPRYGNIPTKKPDGCSEVPK